jgi:hypothetical protein
MRTRPDLQTLSVVFHSSRETTDTVRVQIICLRTVRGHSQTLYADTCPCTMYVGVDEALVTQALQSN